MLDVRPPSPAWEAFDGLGHVFVSYSRWDQLYVSRLVTSFQSAGIPSWISGPSHHCPGWQDTVFPHIASCAVFLAVMTPRSRVALGVDQEISYARSLRKTIIPVAVDGCRFLGEYTQPVECVASCSLPTAAFAQRIKAQLTAAAIDLPDHLRQTAPRQFP